MATVEPETHEAVPRKRRRRAPTTGAADDCFACRKRQSPCDRKRPYCSQCLKVGKECSGYKTTLTWGVGVASRGKLRGMSVPIANAPSKYPGHLSQSKPRGSSMSDVPKPSEAPIKDEYGLQRHRTLSSASSTDGTCGPGFLESIPERGFPFFVPNSQHGWQFPTSAPRSIPANLEPLQTTFDQNGDESGLSSSTGSLISTGSLDTYSESSLDLGHDYPSTPDDLTFNDPFSNFQDGMSSMSSISIPCYPFGQINLQGDLSLDPIIYSPSACDAPHQGQSKTLSTQAFENSWRQFRNDSVTYPVSPTETRQSTQASDGSSRNVGGRKAHDNAPFASLKPSALPPPALDPLPVTPRMQYLIDYYDKAIAPFLVAFDGSDNPYRKYILPLAKQNIGLQNALAALSTNNMRMRRVPDALLADLSSENPVEDAFQKVAAAIGKPTAEEQHYKAMSIEYLNSQLANPMKATDDAVLATLLVLCLFHVCDSGFSKFKTQLAGVQRLLKLRGDRRDSEFIGWVEMFFAWFDVMTSCVNDRETEIHGTSINLMDLSNNLGSLEEFSGCDGSLFKLVARLGRLNLLSQDKPVRAKPKDVRNGYKPARTPSFTAVKRDYYSLESDSDTESAVDDSTSPAERPSFWEEWSDLRLRLQEWQSTRVDVAQMGMNSLPAQEQALLHMSEAFRYSALLYTERLAYPNAPSAMPNIQDLVSQSIYHMEQIGTKSCVTKFLLWPLFVTGTECVQKSQRSFIRARCIDIQKASGFYNNLNGLEVLEKVWRGHDSGVEKRTTGSQPFRWRTVMDRIDGEYIVV